MQLMRRINKNERRTRRWHLLEQTQTLQTLAGAGPDAYFFFNCPCGCPHRLLPLVSKYQKLSQLIGRLISRPLVWTQLHK